jgi:hypothetical protein
MSAYFSYKGIPGDLEDEGDGKMGVVLFLLETGFDESALEGEVANLFFGKFLTHDLLARDLTDNKFFSKNEVFFQFVIFLGDSFERSLYFFTALDDLFLEHLILNASIFESSKSAVLLVDSLDLFVFNFIKQTRGLIVATGQSPILYFFIFHID